MRKAVITEYFDGRDYSAAYRKHPTLAPNDFMADVHDAVPPKEMARYPITEESREIECPDGFVEAALLAAAEGGSLYASTRAGLWESVRDYVGAWRTIEYGKDSPVADPAKHHLGTRISYGGFGYWVTCSCFLTRALVARGELKQGSYGGHVSAGGWMIEETRP